MFVKSSFLGNNYIIHLTYRPYTSVYQIKHTTHVDTVQHVAPWLHGISCRQLLSTGRCCHMTSHLCHTHDSLSYHTQLDQDTCMWQFQRAVLCNKSRICTPDSCSSDLYKNKSSIMPIKQFMNLLINLFTILQKLSLALPVVKLLSGLIMTHKISERSKQIQSQETTKTSWTIGLTGWEGNTSFVHHLDKVNKCEKINGFLSTLKQHSLILKTCPRHLVQSRVTKGICNNWPRNSVTPQKSNAWSVPIIHQCFSTVSMERISGLGNRRDVFQ